MERLGEGGGLNMRQQGNMVMNALMSIQRNL